MLFRSTGSFSQLLCCFDELIPVAASREPLDAEGKMECFFKVFDQRRCRVSRDIEIFPIRIDAKIHRSLVGGTDDTGDAVLLTFIEAFRHGKEEGEDADLTHLCSRQDMCLPIRFEVLSGVSMVKSADQSAHHLFAVCPAEDMRIRCHVAAVAGVAVVIDQISYVMQAGCRGENITHARVELVDLLPLIEHGECGRGDILGVEIIGYRKGIEIILHRAAEHVVLLVSVFVIDGIIVVEE